ncbi:hypothetical protein MANES_03G153550v8 [Manihot esculenta]|uniref:Uncharacterized protein n=1 Tax=Manihot esculenta TaxID=3983 RepID=A0ACB7I1W2_MANES|nr:hypothetical protein MANES_03G153550v8 [Manihot esculenta]
MLVISSARGSDKKTIVIINDLGPNIDFYFHCKSANDDLGPQVLPYRRSWHFEFKRNVFGTTLFYCHMSWKKISHWFNIYVDSRDKSRCDYCMWYVRTYAPCTWNHKTKRFDLCFPWTI